MAVPIKGKMCGNCEYWKGPRTMGPGNHYAMCKFNDIGACSYPYGYKHIKYLAGDKCAHHKMWHEIKDSNT